MVRETLKLLLFDKQLNRHKLRLLNKEAAVLQRKVTSCHVLLVVMPRLG